MYLNDKYQQTVTVLKQLTEIRKEQIEQKKKTNIKQEVKNSKSIAQYIIDDVQQTRDQYQQQLQQQQ